MTTHSSILAWRIPCTKRSLAGYTAWGCKELDTTEWLTHTKRLEVWGSLVLEEKQWVLCHPLTTRGQREARLYRDWGVNTVICPWRKPKRCGSDANLEPAMAWSYRLSPEKINQLTKFSHQASGVAFSKSESGNILLSPPPHTFIDI